MTIRAVCRHNSAETFVEVSFQVEIELPNTTPIEQAEAVAKNLLTDVKEKALRWDDEMGEPA